MAWITCSHEKCWENSGATPKSGADQPNDRCWQNMEAVRSFLMAPKNRMKKATHLWRTPHGIVVSNHLLSAVTPSDSAESALELPNSWRLTGMLIEFVIKSPSSDRSGVMPGSWTKEFHANGKCRWTFKRCSRHAKVSDIKTPYEVCVPVSREVVISHYELRYDASSYEIWDRLSSNEIMQSFDEHRNVIQEKRWIIWNGSWSKP